MVVFIVKVCYLIGKDVMGWGQCIFAAHFPIYMQWSNMRPTSSASLAFTETAGFGIIFSAGYDFPCKITDLNRETSAILAKRIGLEHRINGADGVIPISRQALPGKQFNQRNSRSNWPQCVAKVQKSDSFLRMPKPKATVK